MKMIIWLAGALLLGGCSVISYSFFSYAPQPYKVDQDNTLALKKSGVERTVDVGKFANTVDFDNSCRVTGGVIEKPSGGFEGYIQRAFVAELKAADMYNSSSPKITLTGSVEKMVLTTIPTVHTSSWDIGVRLTSSNGKSYFIKQHYDFNAGDMALADCRQLADHYMVAVQKTLNKLVSAPEFQSLVTP